MAIASRLIGSGVPPQVAVNTVGDSASALTATGTSSQTDALGLSAAINEFTTTASNTGARLPVASPGDSIFVYNAGSQTLSVYGQAGEAIQNGAVNSAFSVATNKGALFIKRSNTAWAAVLTA